jgi:hypothetical protein
MHAHCTLVKGQLMGAMSVGILVSKLQHMLGKINWNSIPGIFVGHCHSYYLRLTLPISSHDLHLYAGQTVLVLYLEQLKFAHKQCSISALIH